MSEKLRSDIFTAITRIEVAIDKANAIMAAYGVGNFYPCSPGKAAN
jgi:hypothetical protein